MLQQLAESGVAALPPAPDESEENAASNHSTASDWYNVVNNKIVN